MAQNLNQYNRRTLIKRSTISGTIPTIPDPSVATDVNDHTQGGWLSTDIYVGEMFINIADNKAWIRYSSGIVELSSISGYPNFTDLTDTPATYSGKSGYMLVVNASETGVEFVDDTHITTITGLSDTPSGITDNYILVGDSGAYIEEPYISAFSGLTDTPTYIGNGGKLLAIKSTQNGVEAVVGNDIYVDLLSNQTVGGNKSFTGDTSVINLDITGGATLDNKTINTIITGDTLIGASQSNIPTTLAIKNYVDDTVITAVGGDYVARTGAVTIEDTKTFQDDTQFDSNVNIDGTTSTKNIEQDISSYHYFGDVNTDGSYRFFINPNGDLEIQKRESGVWVYKANF